jgi:hypothetical protein
MTNRRNVVTLATLTAMLATSTRAQSTPPWEIGAVATALDLNSRRPATDGAIVAAAGYHTPGDGGGGLFVWQASSEDKPDRGLLFGNAEQAGRWRRVHDGPINVRMFGARGDGRSDDTAAIQAAIDAAAGAELRIPAGHWLVNRTLRFRTPPDRHSPGLKIAGDGMNATVIDCRVTDGPALSIEQGRGYVFGQGGFIRDIEFIAPNAPAGHEQDGIVMSGAWLYTLQRVTIRNFRGNGLSVPFVSDRGFVFTGVETVAGSNIARRPLGGLHSTINYAETILGDGIAAGTVVERVLDDESLLMSKPALRGGRTDLNIFGKNPDGQSTVLFAEDCRIKWNGGWGIYGDAGVAMQMSLRECEVGLNSLGGIRTNGFLEMHGGAVGVNGTDDGRGVGILLDYASMGGVQRALIEAVEIDGNRGVNLWLRRVRFARVIRCRFNASERPKLGVQLPKVSIKIGDSDGSGATTVEFIQNMVRTDGVYLWPHTAFEIPDGASVENLDVRNTLFWGGWSDAHHTKYRIGKLANSNARLRFEEEGVISPNTPVSTQYCAQLKRAGAMPVPPMSARMVQFDLVQSNQKVAASWPMFALQPLSDAAKNPRVSAEMPVLLFKDAASLDDLVPSQLTTGADLQGPAHAALVGGTICPYHGYFDVSAVVDVQGVQPSQALSLVLFVDGKPFRTESSAIHGLPLAETLRLTVFERWAAGTALHVGLRNHSPSEVALVQASLTVRLSA